MGSSLTAARQAPPAGRFCPCCERVVGASHVCPHCPACGFDSVEGALYCDFCKEPFIKKRASAAAPAAQPTAVPSRGRRAGWAVAAVALVALCLWRSPPRAPIFDPSRDAARDIASALAQAKASGKLVLIEVGGDWCEWSLALERLLSTDVRLARLREDRFVVVKVYQGPVVYDVKGLTPQELAALKSDVPRSMLPVEALSRYPEMGSYPHLFILDCDGQVIQSKDLDEFESGKSYDPAKLATLLASAR